MKKIKGNIYYNDTYTGTTVGALLFSKDTVLVDAPLKPEDGRAWLALLNKAGAKPRRLTVNLDAHPDRTLGTQTLESQAVAHTEIVRQYRRRATIFKALKQESGAEWEETPGLSGLRWILPRVTFSDHTLLHFDDAELRLEHHPGPGPGASWLVYPEGKVVFVGDAIVVGEPPFLAQADIPAWLKQLDLLSSRHYRGYTIVAGRGGKAAGREINEMRKLLKDVEAKIKKIGKRKNAGPEIEKIAAKMASRYRGNARRHALFAQRLKHGLVAYHSRRYTSGSKSQNTY
jgi:glyoxylase-like metal-dependent hydrolase (beta-lactamase superfamily II)